MKDNQAKYPQLRFKGFTDPWEQRKLGELGSVAMNKRIFKEQTSDTGDVPFYKIGTFGGTPDAFISRDLFEEYKSKYQYPEVGDILISASGSIGRTVVYRGADEYFQDSNIVWLKHDSQLVNSFLKQFYSIVKWQGLEGSTIKRLYNKNILETPITLPSPEEQTKLGEFFEKLDNLIVANQRKLDLLKEQKKGYLQKMFPKNGSKFPQLRFAGFADAWEQRKFKDILKTHSFRSYLAGVSENGDYEVIQQGDKPIFGYSDGEPFTDYKDVTLFGDHTVSLYKPKSPFFVATDGVKILSADNFEGDYLYTTLERYKPEPQGYKRHFTILKNQDVWFTENMEEQQKIGVFFKQLDDTITLHQRKLEKLQELKKGYLQKMFC